MSEQQPQHNSTNAASAEDPSGDWTTNSRSTFLVVVALIATLSFQVGVNPPGGYWQDDDKGHTAGVPVMRDKMYNKFRLLIASSWLCFYSSLFLIYLLLTGTTIASRTFKFNFIFCMSSLVFLFHLSQTTQDNVIFASVFSGSVFAAGLYYVYRK